jgi:hypothetical protein
MSLILGDRIRQTSTTTGSGTLTLDGTVTGFQPFSVLGNGNTTYYTIALNSQWEVGIGTYSAGTLSRDTVLSSSTGSIIAFAAGTKDVFVSYPAEKSVNQDANNRVLIPYTSGVTNTGSLNVGNATVHTDSGVIAGFTASEPLYLYTSLQNTSSANTSYASYAVNDGGHTAYAELGINNSTYSYTAAGFPNNGFSTPLASFVESYGGPLVLGSWDNQKISFITNGAVNTTDAMTINTNGSIAFNGQVGTAGQVLQSNATSAPTWVTLAASGTVTSVAATVPAFLSITGSPITTSGTLAIGLSGTALPVANGGTGVTTSTGTTNVVLSNSPTLVTPALGTPSALVGTNITGTAAGLTAGNVTTNANLTGAITSTGNATLLGSFTSANLSAALTDETGTGAAVFATSPTLVTPALGTPSSGVVTNLTGTASININGTVGATTANTGSFTSIAYSTTLTGGTGIVNLGSGQFYKDASGNVFVAQTAGTGSEKFGVTQTDVGSSAVRFYASSASYVNNIVEISCARSGATTEYNAFCVFDSNTTLKMLIRPNGNLLNSNNSYGSLSDVSLKENIVDATPKLDGLMQVKVRNYNLKDDVNKTKQIGVIAQELETIFPGMIETDGDGIKAVKYSVFVPMLLKALQEQQALITSLTARIAALEA